MPARLFFLFLALMIAAGCSWNQGDITEIMSKDIDAIPTTIGIYPLLTSELPHQRISRRAVLLEARTWKDDVYISPVAETRLLVNLQSQLMTGYLSSELSRAGFSLREIPVQTPEGDSGSLIERESFFISMELIQRLQDDYGVEAILLGNVYFVPDRYDPTNFPVRMAYLKLVDIATLEILYQVFLTYNEYGRDVDLAAEQLAGALAGAAGFSAAPPKERE